MKGRSIFFRRQLCCLRILLAFAIVLQCVCYSSTASAADRDRELLIGIEPEHNIFDQVQKYRLLAGYLSDRLGLQVNLTIMSRYGEVVKRFRTLHLDGAILSSYTTMLAIEELGLAPIANPVSIGERSTSKGYVFVRKDSGIKSVADMRGKSVAFVDEASTEGYLYPVTYFRENGVSDIDTYFSRQYFSGSHASAVFAVLDGRADVGTAKDSVYNRLVSKDRSIRGEINILAESPPVPEVTLCMKNNLDPELVEKIQTILLEMNESVEGHKVLKQIGAKRFVSASPESFLVVKEMAEKAGVLTLKSDDN